MQTPNPTAKMSDNSPYAQCTPGPWSPAQSVNGKICIECDNDTLTIAVVETIHTVREKAEQEANARLIAAAPMLLQEVAALQATNAALRAALENILSDLEDTYDKSRAAIAKGSATMRTEYACIAERTDDDLARCYLDWVNNYLSTSAFADAYGINGWEAVAIINKGRLIHEARAGKGVQS
jgi:hypothetical protein